MSTATLIPLGTLPDGTLRCALDARHPGSKVIIEQDCLVDSYLNHDGAYELFLEGPLRAKKGQVLRVATVVRLEGA
jgi:hypothetical protein